VAASLSALPRGACYGGPTRPHVDMDKTQQQQLGSSRTIMIGIFSRPSNLRLIFAGSRHLFGGQAVKAIGTMSAMPQPVRPRRFAPLSPKQKKDGDKRPILKGIVFDVDGTLCEWLIAAPGTYSRDGRSPTELHVRRDAVSMAHLYHSVKAADLVQEQRSTLRSPRTSSTTSTRYRKPSKKRRMRRFATLSGPR
jgi:hypothetical protein